MLVWSVTGGVVVISRDPVMLLSLLKLSVVWVSMFVLLVCTVCIFFFWLWCFLFRLGLFLWWFGLFLGKCLGFLPFQM